MFQKRQMTDPDEIASHYIQTIREIVGDSTHPRALFVRWSISDPVQDLISKHSVRLGGRLEMPSADMRTALFNLVNRGEEDQALARLDIWFSQQE